MDTNKIILLSQAAIIMLLSFLPCPAAQSTDSMNAPQAITLTGSIISQACYGSVCHGGISADFRAYDSLGSMIYQGRSDEHQWGVYSIPGIYPGHEYKIIINDSAYLRREYSVILPVTDKYEELSRDFLVVPRVKGIEILMNVPPFEPHKTKIRVGAPEFIEPFVSLIEQNPDVKFQVSCFPDNDDNDAANYGMTLERSYALREYLAARGIDPNRLSVAGNPQTDPKNAPPKNKQAKGKRYVGSTYLVVTELP